MGPAYFQEVLQITSDGPIAFPRSSVNNIGWGPDMPPKFVADVIKWPSVLQEAQQITLNGPIAFTRSSVHNIDGPRHDGKTVADVNKWAQHFLESSANYIRWAKTCRQNPLLMLLNGPSVFSGGSANYIGWAQRFTEKFCQ